MGPEKPAKKRGRPPKKRAIDAEGLAEIAANEPKEEKPPGLEEIKHHRPEEITVYYPEQLFGPVPYNSFRCGNLWYKTFTQPGETAEEAYQRAWEFLSKRVEEQYLEVKKDFWRRYEGMTV